MKQDLIHPVASDAMTAAARYGLGFRNRVRPLHATADAAALRRGFGDALPERGQPGSAIIDELIRAAEPGLVGNTRPGFHAWVMGGSHPVGVAADWLTSVWGQNAALYQGSPAAATAEETAARWMLDLLDLPRHASVGFVTGATMAGFTCLAAARHEVLRRAGHDFDRDGLAGSPRITVFMGDDAHISNMAALRYLGFGTRDVVTVSTDSEGRMETGELMQALDWHAGPKIIIATAGHINSGAFDDFHTLADLAAIHDAWLHVDAAFGLWARAVPDLAHLTRGLDRADSWSTDGHKWLQIPYDSGFAIVRDRSAHRAAMDITAGYLTETPQDGRNPTHFNPELSRRARGFAVWAVLKALGRQGVADMVRGHCDCASLLGHMMARTPGVTVVNQVVLNQVVLRFGELGGRGDALTRAMEEAINADGRFFLRTADWRGRVVLRVSVIEDGTGPAEIRALGLLIRETWARLGAGGSA